MDKKISKMQVRFELLAILNKYRLVKIPSGLSINNDISAINSFEDKDFIAKILFKEMLSDSQEFSNVCAIFALEVLNEDVFERHAIEVLSDSNVSDNKKFFIISLIKQKGINFNYDEISSYVESPNNVAHDSVMDFLSNALFDPEAKIDLVDFYVNISYNEKLCLLNNLTAETPNDNVASALSLLIQLNLGPDEFNIIYQGLSVSSSPYALEGLKYILSNYDISSKIAWDIKKQIKKIENENEDFKKNSIIAESEVFDCFIGYVDGNSNFSIGIARKLPDESIYTMFTTVNLNNGISATLGFGNINYDSYITIKRRLFCDSMPYQISPTAAKSILLHYKAKNKKTDNAIPYEYLIWSEMFFDISSINYDLSDYINNMLDSINLTEEKVDRLLSSKILESWFFLPSQNEKIDNLIKTIEQQHLLELEQIDILVQELANNFLKDKDFYTELIDKLLLQAYVARLAKLKMSSSVLYSLCFKNPYINKVVSKMIYKSIYIYLIECHYNYQVEGRNIFKAPSKTTFKQEELEIIMSQIEEMWG